MYIDTIQHQLSIEKAMSLRRNILYVQT